MGDILACNTPIRCTISIPITTWHVFGVWHLLGIDEENLNIQRKKFWFEMNSIFLIFKYPVSFGKFEKIDNILKYGFETWIFLTFMKGHTCASFCACLFN